MLRLMLDDGMWERMKTLLPANKGRHGEDDRLFLEAVLWVLRTGSPWRDLPTEFGKWQTVYGRYSRWVKKGNFSGMLEQLKSVADNEWNMIDGSITRAHKHAAGAKKSITDQGLGRSCGGFSSKVHAKVDSFGMPLKFIVTAGQEHDMKQAEALVGDDECEMLLADRGYDSDDFRKALQNKGIQPVIPGKKNRKTKIEYDEHTYKERNAVERFFARMKEFRRLATRFDKTKLMFVGSLTLWAVLTWLKL